MSFACHHAEENVTDVTIKNSFNLIGGWEEVSFFRCVNESIFPLLVWDLLHVFDFCIKMNLNIFEAYSKKCH